jgi:hypothetical protein
MQHNRPEYEFTDLGTCKILWKKGENRCIVFEGDFFYVNGQDPIIEEKHLSQLGSTYPLLKPITPWDGVKVKECYYIRTKLWDENWFIPYKQTFPFLQCATPLIEELWNGMRL